MAIEKQKLILITGVVLGIMAIAMTKVYLDQQQQVVQEKAKAAIANIQSNQTAVLVAKKDIQQGAVVEGEMFESSIVPNKFVQPQAVTSLDRISGMVTVAPISKGEQISLSKLTSVKQAGGGNLAGLTPVGKRAISIAVDNMATLAGMVNPGDYVDVLAIVQISVPDREGRVISQIAVVPLFQNILVLAVGQNTGTSGPTSRYAENAPASSGGSNGSTLITLALGPQEANLVAFVQEQGKLRLAMRSPADAKIEPITPASWESFFQYIMPPQPEQVQPVVVDTNEYIEVVRGLSKERVALSK
ncbi:MAG: Flp pilus assembly protein CpaB [Candidatus Omnitrophica bacterium]|nr:Flp pilus assembly protein CpaB [Candidatus Omnitrophota bacterium]